MKRDLDQAFNSLSLEDEAKQIEKTKIEAPASSQWISVFTSRPYMKQRYHYNVSDARVYMHIENGNKIGIKISSVASSSNLWAMMMDAGTGFSSQVYDLSSVFVRKDWIVEQWEKNYHITSIAGANNGKSLVVMSQGTNYANQSYKVTRAFPYAWINKKWRDGFHVTSMANSRSRWCVVMSVNSGYTDQVVEFDSFHLNERIKERSENGYIITSMAATTDQTAFILSIPKQKVTDETQETLRTVSFPRTNLKEQWKKNMYITSMCYGRTVWDQNALKCDDIPDFLAALNISDNHRKTDNEEVHNIIFNSPRKRECSSLNRGKDKVTIYGDELECYLANCNISEILYEKSGNEETAEPCHVTQSPSLPWEGLADKFTVGDGNLLPVTHSGSVDLPSTSGTCEGQEDKTTCKIEKST